MKGHSVRLQAAGNSSGQIPNSRKHPGGTLQHPFAVTMVATGRATVLTIRRRRGNWQHPSIHGGFAARNRQCPHWQTFAIFNVVTAAKYGSSDAPETIARIRHGNKGTASRQDFITEESLWTTAAAMARRLNFSVFKTTTSMTRPVDSNLSAIFRNSDPITLGVYLFETRSTLALGTSTATEPTDGQMRSDRSSKTQCRQRLHRSKRYQCGWAACACVNGKRRKTMKRREWLHTRGTYCWSSRFQCPGTAIKSEHDLIRRR
jgi:hypothetical protein